MTGIPLHPLRLAALDRMSVLRVPMNPQPKVIHAQYADGSLETNCIFRKGDQRIHPPYTPGDYFVKEAWWEPPYITGKMLRDGADTWPEIVYDADEDDISRDQWREWGWKRRSSMHLQRSDSRYILTLGPPVPCRLGNLKNEDVIKEGIYDGPWPPPLSMACKTHPIDVYEDYWNQIYPRHPYSPDLWTWGYPVERRGR